MDKMNRASESTQAASTWDTIRTHLQREQSRILGEIRNYPPPIPACDQQFNYLLQQRESIARELHRLRELQGQIDSTADPRPALEQFIRSSQHLDDDAKHKLASQIDPTRK